MEKWRNGEMNLIGVGGCSASGAFYLFSTLFSSTVVPTLPKYTPNGLKYLMLPYVTLYSVNNPSQKKIKKNKNCGKENGGVFAG